MPGAELARWDEPTLSIKNIQGNIVPGFNKPFQALLFFKIIDPARLRLAIAELASRVTTAEQVLKFKRELREAKAAGRTPPTARWVNVAFSCAGLKILRTDALQFADGPFGDGMANGSRELGDPEDPAEPGHPQHWNVRDDTAHLMVIVAADVESDREAEIEAVRGII